jgi:hypothetical protein
MRRAALSGHDFLKDGEVGFIKACVFEVLERVAALFNGIAANTVIVMEVIDLDHRKCEAANEFINCLFCHA